MVYVLDMFGRPTGEKLNRDMSWYMSLDIIPRNITDIPPPAPQPDHEVVFNGREWVQWPVEKKETE